MQLTVKRYASIVQIPAESWDRLNTAQNPFLRHSFFAALEQSGSVSTEAGWRITHLGWHDSEGQLQAALPQYYKSHSYGEYMFDWDWARGISQAGIGYYPKAVAAIPFTPVTGARLMLSEGLSHQKTARIELIKQIIESVKEQQLSNLQCLFLAAEETDDWQQAGAMIRRGYQFSWYNNNYQNFDDFLTKLRSSARKKIKRERRMLVDNGVSFKTYENTDISDEIWEFFIQCYQQTYLKRSGHLGYLNNDFFKRLKATMNDHLVVVQASRNNSPVAASLFIKGNNILYGRYWGTVELIDGLHFECCYYQGIDYCINNHIDCLQPGTQGDYKRRRGFIPEYVFGAYYFSDQNLQQPIQDYLNHETTYLEQQFSEWQNSTPYK